MISRTSKGCRRPNRGEEGYTIFAIVAVLMIAALIITAAAPDIRRQAQREREKEAIFRGEQVAEAIRLYFRYSGRLPTSMEQLAEGVPRGTKRIQVLRAAAAVDPLTESGRWRLIKPGSASLVQFQSAVTLYAGGVTPPTREAALFQRYGTRVTSVVDSTSNSDSFDLDDSPGEFIGVASRSRSESLITYYGIDRHDQWIFTPLFR